MDTGGDREVETNWESSIDISILPCVKWLVSGKLLYTAGALWWPIEVGWGGGKVRGLRGKGHKYTHSWFTLLHGGNRHNIVKQLYSNQISQSTKDKISLWNQHKGEQFWSGAGGEAQTPPEGCGRNLKPDRHTKVRPMSTHNVTSCCSHSQAC